MTDEQLYIELCAFISENKRALFDRIAPERMRHVTVVLEDIYQSHNASAVVRTCDLLGVQDIHVIENRNKYTLNPDVTLGSSKWVDLHRWREGPQNTLDCILALKAKGYRIAATSPHGNSVELKDLDLSTPIAFCFGTELEGLSKELLAAADTRVRIPMHGFTESYNISVSAAIVLFTVTERLRMSNVEWKLSAEQIIELKLEWARKTRYHSSLIEERLRERSTGNDEVIG
ncbi:MAG: RNA methyltransferase [Flavobacteriales bacterium]|nr:RNA methyltransferase [Flavobacteriales bacterium]MBK9194605.1 RNA methyltransferase [Flavobacteriales bacterium]